MLVLEARLTMPIRLGLMSTTLVGRREKILRKKNMTNDLIVEDESKRPGKCGSLSHNVSHHSRQSKGVRYIKGFNTLTLFHSYTN